MDEEKKDNRDLIQQIKQVVRDELKQGQSKNLPVPIIAEALQLPTTQQLKDHLCPGISDSDAFVFLETAKLFGLNPFKKEIYAMPFKTKTGKIRYSPVIDYHVFLARAKQYPTYLYFDVGLRQDENKKVDGAWCKIYDEKFGFDGNGSQKFFYHEIDADEYDKKQSTWSTKRNTMLKKTAIRQAHNLCYPELAGLPPVKDMLIVDASGTVVAENGELPKSESVVPKVDEDFFGEPSDKNEKVETKKETSSKALPEQIGALGKIFEHPTLPQQLSTELVDVLDKHESGEKILSRVEASKLISKYQRSIIDAKEKAKAEQPAPEH